MAVEPKVRRGEQGGSRKGWKLERQTEPGDGAGLPSCPRLPPDTVGAPPRHLHTSTLSHRLLLPFPLLRQLLALSSVNPPSGARNSS